MQFSEGDTWVPLQDSLDEPELLKVQFEQYLSSNASVIDGHCAGGWKKIGNTCFLFVPARMNYQEAKKFCQVRSVLVDCFVKISTKWLDGLSWHRI